MLDYSAFEEEEEETQDKVLSSIGFKRVVDIETDLIDVSFKSVEIGDTSINIANHLLVRNVYNTLADNLVRATASNAVQIQSMLCEHSDIVDGIAKKPSKFFDKSTFELKEKYVNKCTPAQKVRVETLYAEGLVFKEALNSLSTCFDASFTRTTTGLQYAFVGETGARNTGFKVGAIYSMNEAFQYRYKNDNRYLAICKIVEKRRKGDKEIDALDKEQNILSF